MCSEPCVLCGDTAGLALTFGHEGFQPFLEDPAVNMDCPDETLSFGILCVFTDLSVTECPLSLSLSLFWDGPLHPVPRADV